MRKNIVVVVVCTAIGLFIGWLIFGKSSNPVGRSSPATSERKIAYYKDPMHPWFTSDKPGKAPDCGMDMVPVYEGESEGNGVKIDPVVVQNIGVKIEEVKRRPLHKTIRTVGKITYDETKLYNVNTKIAGWVEKLYVDYTGKAVRKGDPLLEIYSPELVNTQEEYLLAIHYEKQLQLSNVEEARKGAEDLVASAKRRLLYWDISLDDIQEIEKLGVPKKVMTIYSPANGIVVDKMVIEGQNIMAGMTLYKIADLSNVWVLADIYQSELAWVKLHQATEVDLSYLPGRTFRGKVTYIYPFLSEETKTIKVRIEVRNPREEILLKPDMYANVKIKSPQAINAIAVPDQAILRSGERNILVVSLGGGYFDPREVKLGVTADAYVQILEGIKEGERIVTSSQFLIDSESNLKAAIGLMGGHAGHDMSKPEISQEMKNTPKEIILNGDEGQKTLEMEKGEKSRKTEGQKVKPAIRKKSATGTGAKTSEPQKQLYTCVMHPEVVSDKPGDCPKCGMKLVPKED